MSDKNFALSEAELKSFHENGFIGPFTLYEQDNMKERFKKTLRGQLFDQSNAIYAVDNAKSGATNLSNYDRHFDVPFLAEHLNRPEIVDRIASILGPDVLCWRSEFFPKYKGDEGTDWHQASTFANTSTKPKILWPENEHNEHLGGTLTVWTAFTDSTLENGCLQLMPGTHKKLYYDESKTMKYNADKINKLEKDSINRGFFGYDYRELQVDPDWRPDESKAFPVVMKAGQFLIFWSTLMHASLPHRSTLKDMRLGFVGRFVPTKVQVYPGGATHIEEFGGRIDLARHGSMLVSGQDIYGHNRLADSDVYGNAFPKVR